MRGVDGAKMIASISHICNQWQSARTNELGGGSCRPNDESLIEWNNSIFGNLFLQLPPLDADLSILGNQNKTDRKLQNLPLAKFPLWESTSPVFVVICQTNSATTKSYIKYGSRPPFQISFLLDREQSLALCKVNWELGVQN